MVSAMYILKNASLNVPWHRLTMFFGKHMFGRILWKPQKFMSDHKTEELLKKLKKYQ